MSRLERELPDIFEQEGYADCEEDGIYNIYNLSFSILTRDLEKNYIDKNKPDEEHAYDKYEELKAKSEKYISRIKNFDKSIFIKNLNYLMKKFGIRVGILEEMLGISSGYISRTAKYDSEKKLSVDVVWKIGYIFGIDIKDLLETDLEEADLNDDMITKFLNRLIQETHNNKKRWSNHGGCSKSLGFLLDDSELFSIEAGKTVYNIKKRPATNSNSSYYIDDLRCGNKTFVLTEDVYSCFVHDDREVIIIFFSEEGNKDSRFVDFLFTDRYVDGGDPAYKKLFYSSDDDSGAVINKAQELLRCIRTQEMNHKLSSEAYYLIEDYLEYGDTSSTWKIDFEDKKDKKGEK